MTGQDQRISHYMCCLIFDVDPANRTGRGRLSGHLCFEALLSTPWPLFLAPRHWSLWTSALDMRRDNQSRSDIWDIGLEQFQVVSSHRSKKISTWVKLMPTQFLLPLLNDFWYWRLSVPSCPSQCSGLNAQGSGEMVSSVCTDRVVMLTGIPTGYLVLLVQYTEPTFVFTECGKLPAFEPRCE